MAKKQGSTLATPQSGKRRGQAIAIGMLAYMERIDREGVTPADACAFWYRPAGTKQDNIVLRYLRAVRALNDPSIEAGFCSVLSGCLAENAFGCSTGSVDMKKWLKLRPARLAIPT